MANIKEIRDRIDSVKETRKITNAMYLISSTKLRKARKVLADTEPFFYASRDMIASVVKNLPEGVENIFLETRQDIPEKNRKRGYIIITDDRGMVGSYNHNVIKAVDDSIEAFQGQWKLFVIGDIGRHHYTSQNIDVEEYFAFTSETPTLHRARKIAAEILDYYYERKIDEFYIVYTTMKGMSTEANMEKLLPLDIITDIRRQITKPGQLNEELLMDPSPSAILNNIVPNYITGFIYGALVESFSSAHNARMLAMDSANKNADKMINTLTRNYNTLRQALITQEITEVVSGAKALKRAKDTKNRKKKSEAEAKN